MDLPKYCALYMLYTNALMASQVTDSVVKNPRGIAGDAGNTHSIPGSGRPLEKETATHSSILAWKIPWTEEPGGLPSMGFTKSWT